VANGNVRRKQNGGTEAIELLELQKKVEEEKVELTDAWFPVEGNLVGLVCGILKFWVIFRSSKP